MVPYSVKCLHYIKFCPEGACALCLLSYLLGRVGSFFSLLGEEDVKADDCT